MIGVEGDPPRDDIVAADKHQMLLFSLRNERPQNLHSRRLALGRGLRMLDLSATWLRAPCSPLRGPNCRSTLPAYPDPVKAWCPPLKIPPLLHHVLVAFFWSTFDQVDSAPCALDCASSANFWESKHVISVGRLGCKRVQPAVAPRIRRI